MALTTDEQVQDVLFNWVVLATGLDEDNVVWTDQPKIGDGPDRNPTAAGAPEKGRPFVTLQIIRTNALGRSGGDVRHITPTAAAPADAPSNVVKTRQGTLVINAYAESAQDVIEAIRAFRDKPTAPPVQPPVAATATIATIAAADLVNNETFTLDDGAGQVAVFEFDRATFATTTIMTIAGLSHVDEETFTISDGTNTKIFELDENGSVSPGNVLIDVTNPLDPQPTADEMRNRIISAVNGETGPSFQVAASNGGVATVLLTHQVVGIGGSPVSDTVADGGFVTLDFGAASTISPGNVLIDLSTEPDADGVRDLIVTAIGLVSGWPTLLIVGTDGGAATVDLTHLRPGRKGNAASGTETVSDAGFIISAFSGGEESDVAFGRELGSQDQTAAQGSLFNARARIDLEFGYLLREDDPDVGAIEQVQFIGQLDGTSRVIDVDLTQA